MGTLILITGGTFDKEYNEISENLFFRDSHVSEMLKLGRCELDVHIVKLMMVDSLYMTDKGRRQIVEKCRRTRHDRVVITHGTGTMVETARELAAAKLPRTIVLTGAMIPYRVVNSDAMFNLGTALAYSQSMPEGVYLAMNGCCFDWNNVKKNTRLGRFVKTRNC